MGVFTYLFYYYLCKYTDFISNKQRITNKKRRASFQNPSNGKNNNIIYENNFMTMQIYRKFYNKTRTGYFIFQ